MTISTQAATPELRRALEAQAQRRFGTFGGVERRGASPVSDFPTELRADASGDPSRDGQLVVKGYASVFNKLSLDLGGCGNALIQKVKLDGKVVELWPLDPSYVSIVRPQPDETPTDAVHDGASD